MGGLIDKSVAPGRELGESESPFHKAWWQLSVLPLLLP
jgi:hypothetical protein